MNVFTNTQYNNCRINDYDEDDEKKIGKQRVKKVGEGKKIHEKHLQLLMHVDDTIVNYFSFFFGAFFNETLMSRHCHTTHNL